MADNWKKVGLSCCVVFFSLILGGFMKLSHFRATIVVFSLFLCGSLMADEPESKDNDLAKAKILGWQTATQIVTTLEAGDQQLFPGTAAWLKDFHEQTKGIDEKVSPEKWPAFDVDVLVTHNPRFWQMCYEVAPADPGMAIVHAGLLMAAGEEKRAYHVLQVMYYRPNLPQEIQQAFEGMMGTALQAGKQSNAIIQEGVKLHDAGDYAGAIKKYKEAHSLWPQNGLAYYELGFTLRTKLETESGKKPRSDGIETYSDKEAEEAKVDALVNTPQVVAAFAKARQHDPLQYMAYQGGDQEVIQGFLAMQKKILPAIKKLDAKPELAVAYKYLTQLAEGYQEANQHELALLARQSMVAFRGRYEPADHPFITKSLQKIAPGPETDATLKRLAGRELAFRQLVAVEMKNTYFPDSPAEEVSKKVKVDHIQLLTDEKDIVARTTAEDLAKFGKEAEKIACGILEKSDKSFDIMVQFKCSPSGHEVQIFVKQESKDFNEFLKKLHEDLSKMEKLPVKEGTVEFQMILYVNP
jgi:tetratricopeptide (TPR) repeat protein